MDRLAELSHQIPYSNYVALAVGVVVLLAGRKLYWLATGGLGFVIGLYLASRYMTTASYWVEVGVALAAGIAGAFLTVLAQKATIALAGIVLGGVGVYTLCLPFAADLATGIWWLAILGAVLGFCFAAFLFDAAVMVVSSIVGAVLILGSVELPKLYETWGFLVLFCVGTMVQSRQKGVKKSDED